MKKLLPLLSIGFFLRLFVLFNTPIVNPDVALHLETAKAIYEREETFFDKDKVIYLYSLSTAFLYPLFHNWILSAKLISLLSGTLSIIPLYLLLKRFFDLPYVLLSSLSFALNPYFAFISGEIIKDPLFFLFFSFALYFFIASKERAFLSFLSSLFFVLSILLRIEAIIYLLLSFIFLFFRGEKKKTIIFFLLPLFLFSFLLFLSFPFSLYERYLKPRILAYGMLEIIFGKEPLNFRLSSFFLFFPIFLERFIKICYPPFFLVFFIPGIFSLKIKKEERGSILYIFLILASLIPVLLLLWLKTGFFSSRYLIPFVVLQLIFISSGIALITDWLKKRKGSKKAFIFVSILIFLFSLPANLQTRRADKIVLKEIGDFIREREGRENVNVLGPDVRIEFYANLHSLKPKKRFHTYSEIEGLGEEAFIKYLKDEQIKYFVFEERGLNGQIKPSFFESDSFKYLKEWNDKKRGKMILYLVKLK